jgi:hypothetical protein
MRHLLFTLAVILATVTTMSLALAQSDPMEIPWYTIDGGGSTASSVGDFVLFGTIGQPDAGVSSGQIYTVHGGFWGVRSPSPAPPKDFQVYLPLILR